jgi:hypothetical protein
MTTFVVTQTRTCECTTSRRGLVPIPVGGQMVKYEICPKCGTVWVTRYRTLEAPAESVQTFDMNDARLPEAVRQHARTIVGIVPRN